MFCVVSSHFRVLRFPHQGKIVAIDQLAFFSSESSTGNVPYVGKTNITYENVRGGIFKVSSLMGTFSLPPPTNVGSVKMIDNFGDTMLLSPVEQSYQTILMASAAAFEAND